MRRPHGHLAATDRRPDHSAFSTPSHREGLMKRSLSLQHCSGLSVPTLYVCLSGPPYTFIHAPSLPIQVDLHSKHPSHLGSPPWPGPFRPRPPPHRQDQTLFKPHSVCAAASFKRLYRTRAGGVRALLSVIPTARIRYSTNVSRALFVAAAFRPAFSFQQDARLKPAPTIGKLGFSHSLFRP